MQNVLPTQSFTQKWTLFPTPTLKLTPLLKPHPPQPPPYIRLLPDFQRSPPHLGNPVPHNPFRHPTPLILHIFGHDNPSLKNFLLLPKPRPTPSEQSTPKIFGGPSPSFSPNVTFSSSCSLSTRSFFYPLHSLPHRC